MKSSKKSKKKAPPFILIKGAEVITMDGAGAVAQLDVKVVEDRIAEMGPRLKSRGASEVIDGKGMVLMPGLVQAHVHLCQTLFRAQADDMQLLQWLQERVWPLEGALTAPEMKASARLAISELLLGGTTTILDMGTVRHTDELFEQAKRMGLRYTGGKAIMDLGQGYPAGLRETTEEAVSESVRLCERWHETSKGRLRYAFSPRFVLSATEEAMRACVKEARARGALLHTHSSENAEEIQLVRSRTGMGNVEYLHSIGFTGPDVLLAHGIWLSLEERKTLAQTKTRIVHCPSSNLKLASGIARVAELLGDGIHLALGADGAACSNGLDAFMELRLAALLHKVRGGPEAVPAATALHMATRGGALAMGLNDVGSIEVGHKADVVLVDLQQPHLYPPAGDLVSRVVYSARASDVRTVLIDGKVVVRDGELQTAKLSSVLAAAKKAGADLVSRVG